MLPNKKNFKLYTIIGTIMFIILLFIAFSKNASTSSLVSKKQRTNGLFTKYEYTKDKTLYDSLENTVLIGESSSKWKKIDKEKESVINTLNFYLAPEYSNFIKTKSFTGSESFKLKLDPCTFKTAAFGNIKIERFKVDEISKITKKIKSTSYENIITITPKSFKVIYKDPDGKTWFKDEASNKKWCETLILPKDIETTKDPLDLAKITYVSKID